MDENKTFGFGTEDQQEQVAEQIYGQPQEQAPEQEQTYIYGQPQEQAPEQEQTYTYGQPQEQTYGQPQEQTYGQQTYGQQAYGQPNYGMGAMPLDKNGQPIKNNSTMKFVFSILEMLSCCCCCALITFIMGICGCVFTSKANNAFKEGRWAEYQSEAKKASIFLWIGVGALVLSLIFNVAVMSSEDFQDAFEQGYNAGYDAAYDYESDEEYEYEDYFEDEDFEDYFAEDDVDVEEELGAEEDAEEDVASEPVEVIPGEGFTDPTMTLNGATVTFPLTYPELVEAGFYIDAEDEEYVINKNEYAYPTLYTADGTDVGYVYIGNETDGPLTMRECIVFGFDVSSYGLSYEDLTFSLPNGLNQNATAEDFIEAFGTPDDEYISEDYDYQSYTWYNHNDMYYDTSENSISVDFWDGAIDEFEMKYIGWE